MKSRVLFKRTRKVKIRCDVARQCALRLFVWCFLCLLLFLTFSFVYADFHQLDIDLAQLKCSLDFVAKKVGFCG